MAISISFRSEQLDKWLAEADKVVQRPARMLNAIGQYLVGVSKQKFQRAGPGWPPKPEHWAYWEGNKNVPLSGQTNRLSTDIESQVMADGTIRVGSPHIYAATQQFGSIGVRRFNVWIRPEFEPGVHGPRIARFPNGLPKGRLVIGPSPGKIGGGRQIEEFYGQTMRVNAKKEVEVIRVLVEQKITARPFLPEVGEFELDQIKLVIDNYLVAQEGYKG